MEQKPYRVERGTYGDIEVIHHIAVRNGWICRVEHDATPTEYILRIWGKCK